MTLTHGFALEREQSIPELSATARVYRHAKTGGRLLSIQSPDENKVFGIAFRTPPADSTGLPHILEHSVLCGSKKFPVKEPFVELIKGSLNTFLNALTFPDKTCYPVASANTQDFYNLVDVYLDAVFFPLLTENTLKQEGWHYEAGAPDEPLNYKGVVFNEMKGAYSSPESLLSEYSQRALFPDTCYGLDSGGDPERIPDLTFAQFMDFHTRHYHPSNAYAFFSGDDEPEKRLAILDEIFSQFAEAEKPASGIALQPPFAQPRRVTHHYAADDAEAQALCTVNLLLPEIAHHPAGPAAGQDLSLALGVLEHVLIGLPSSPLRKALVDSGLGEDLAGGGLETDLRQLSFSVGLKGLNAQGAEDAATRVEELVLSTLRALADTANGGGLHKDDIEAAMNSVEFELRENNTGSYPRGLAVFFEALSTWLYDGDPLMLLPFEAPLARLKARLAAGEPLLENLIRTHFLENTHRALVLLVPDLALGEAREAAEQARLAAVRAALSPADLDRLAEETRALHALQEAPDSPEDLARIPRLTLADLPRTNARIPHERTSLAGAPAHLHELPTSGIVYLDLGLDLSAVPDALLPLVPILGRALLEMGTRRTPFMDLTRKIAMTTGGIWAQPFVSTVRQADGTSAALPAQRLFLRSKATAERTPALLDILAEVLLEPDFSDTERLGKIVLEAKARREQRLIPAGHSLAAARLKARYGAAQAMGEAMQGLTGFFYVRELAQRMESAPESVVRDLNALLGLMLRRQALVVNATADATALADTGKRLESLLQAVPDLALAPAPRVLPDLPPREGLCLPAQVNYVCAGANVKALGHSPGAAAAVVGKFLNAGYLWERVRVQGGAYGAGVSYSRTSGNLTFVSYRDPNLLRTVEAFAGVAPYLAGLELDAAELDKSIIGSVGDMDHYQLPDAKGFTALARDLTGEDEAYRQAAREAVLSAGPQDFLDFGEAVRAATSQGCLVIAGGKDALGASGLDLSLTKVL
ncbi:MAG: insulinase family protein [Proteobacteria bacterium]|nr:insulinase family protein [Pseudomonadota bacterium]MBU1594926.1 insulinase family protein [Pseudomonadota bacterium]